MKKMTPEELEQFIHRELRGLPAPRAPRTLEARVLAALEHQAQIPWYHQSWAYWPAAIRALFLALTTGLAGGMLVGAFRLIRGFEAGALQSEISGRFTVLAQLYSFAQWLGDFFTQMASSIPNLWLWSALAIFMALNAAFFGLGAVAYRTLYQKN